MNYLGMVEFPHMLSRKKMNDICSGEGQFKKKINNTEFSFLCCRCPVLKKDVRPSFSIPSNSNATSAAPISYLSLSPKPLREDLRGQGCMSRRNVDHRKCYAESFQHSQLVFYFFRGNKHDV